MTGFKEDLLKLARALGIESNEFDAVGIYEWPSIMKKIEQTFIIKRNSNIRFNWWWENLKGPEYGMNAENPIDCLSQFIDLNEKVWFVACDSYHDPNKFWLFPGYIKPIQRLL